MPQGARETDIKTNYLNLLAPDTDYEVKYLPRLDKKQKTSLSDLRAIVRTDYQPDIDAADITVICEVTWFQAIYKNCKPMTLLGYKLTDSNNNVLMFAPNPFTIMYDTSVSKKIVQCMNAVNSVIFGNYKDPGKDIIQTANYYTDFMEIVYGLKDLLVHDTLTCDIETRSLCHIDAGLVSISFAWNQNEGTAIYVNNDVSVLKELKEFFENYKGRLIFHNISYDVYVLIYVLYMKDPMDYEGLLQGLKIFLDRDRKSVV